MKIHILGPSGSGTSTLGRALAEMIGAAWFDSDDFFWEKTDPPFTRKRRKEDRVALLRETLEPLDSWILSGSGLGWIDFLKPSLDLVVYKYVEPMERIARLRRREAGRFGARIEPGGDMYEEHRAFISWAEGYESGGLDMRSGASEEAWMADLSCPVVRITGMSPTHEETAQVMAVLKA